MIYLYFTLTKIDSFLSLTYLSLQIKTFTCNFTSLQQKMTFFRVPSIYYTQSGNSFQKSSHDLTHQNIMSMCNCTNAKLSF